MYCSHCGQELSEQPSYCPHCGKSTQKPPAKGRHLRFWLILAAVVVIAAASIGVYLRRRNSSVGPAQVIANQPATPSLSSTAQLTSDAIYQMVSPAVVFIEKLDDNGQRVATGSGFVVDRNGSIATNYHVVRGASNLRIHFASGATADCTGVLGYDAAHDVALLATGQQTTSIVAFPDSDNIAIGDRVFAIGSPFGLQNTISDGIISSIRNGLLQTTAPISPGSSGGALINAKGQVIGITAAQVQGIGSENLNFAVPISAIRPYMGNTQLISLSTIVEQNTTRVPVRVSFNLEPRQAKQLPIVIGQDRANARLDGTIESEGGFGGTIDVRLANTSGTLYDSGASNHAEIHQPLPLGRYTLTFASEAVILPRTVHIDLMLSYVH
jgi:hypothetical protein